MSVCVSDGVGVQMLAGGRRDKLGRQPAHLAARSGHSDCLAVLLRDRHHHHHHHDDGGGGGGDDAIVGIDRDGRTALHCAAWG